MSELNRRRYDASGSHCRHEGRQGRGRIQYPQGLRLRRRVNTENVTITTKTDKPGIDIRFVPGCKDSCHIPVIITVSGLRETVYNDFYVGEGADVTIIAGCGIHNWRLGRFRARRRAHVLRRQKRPRQVR